MASCLVPDFPAVMVALEHLRELDKQLKEEGLPFTSEASLHLGEITAAVTELEAARRAVHEQLEVETIENGKLRHQIHNVREGISQEIMADVAAVRECNAEEMERLHQDLNAISQLQEAMVKKQEALQKQNAALYPERERVKAEHEDNIAAVNYQISQKFGLQIQLNQTLKQVEELKACIGTVKQNKITVQQNTTQEREAFAATKADLVKEVEQSVRKIQQQRQENGRNQRELDRVNDQQRDTHDHLSALTNHMAQLESSVGRLTASQCQCEKQLEEEIQKHEELAQQRETLERELRELRETLSNTTQRLREDMVIVDCELEEGGAVRGVHRESLAKVSERFRSQDREENEARADHTNVSRRLERSKLRLEERIASIVKHRMEIKEMDEQSRQLLETNVINKDLFQRNLEGLQGQLDAERKSVGQFEEEKERLSWRLEEAEREQEEHVAKVTSDISEARRRYQELRREEAELQQHQSMNSEIDSLTSLVSQAELDYSKMEKEYHREIQRYAVESEHVARSSEEKEREVEEREEALKEVEARFDEEQSTHQRLKHLTAELKSKEDELERSVQELKENTGSLLQPREEMRAELEEMRARYLDLLGNQAAELRAIETSIYDTGVRLEQVNMENSRLHLCIAQMKQDVGGVRRDRDRNSREIRRLTEEVNALFGRLVEAWREDLVLTQECQGSDSVVLESMGFLLNHLQTRRLQLGNVNTHLHQQLFCISKLLGK
ncbi:coiled-coil domain-containing protein 175 [Centroberyx affinis]|uniref:coiled-coil domain-containing protein 175 n=1 Tax=Centroberyx affinis TaxID=166261 RepID=UPI003A5C31D6